MAYFKTWLLRKLDEPCGCHSGKAYRFCCLHREIAYFVIGVVTALALFSAHDVGLLAIIPIILIAALAGGIVARHYRRATQKEQSDKNDVAS
jgi:hypothetical protein